MPGERMTAGDRALLAFLRKRYTSATISRESEWVAYLLVEAFWFSISHCELRGDLTGGGS